MFTLEHANKERASQRIVHYVLERIGRSNGEVHIALPFGGDGQIIVRDLADSWGKSSDFSPEKVHFYQSEEVVYPGGKGPISFRTDLVKHLEPLVGSSLIYLPSHVDRVESFCRLIQGVSFDVAVESCSDSGALLGLQEVEDEDVVWYGSLDEVYGPGWRNRLEARFGSQPDDTLPSHFISLGSKAALFSGLLLVMVNGEKKRWVVEDISKKGESLLSKIITTRERKSLQTILFTDVDW